MYYKIFYSINSIIYYLLETAFLRNICSTVEKMKVYFFPPWGSEVSLLDWPRALLQAMLSNSVSRLYFRDLSSFACVEPSSAASVFQTVKREWGYEGAMKV